MEWINVEERMPDFFEKDDENDLSYSENVAISNGEQVWIAFLENSEEYGPVWRIMEDDMLLDIELEDAPEWMVVPNLNMRLGDYFTIEEFNDSILIDEQ